MPKDSLGMRCGAMPAGGGSAAPEHQRTVNAEKTRLG